MDLTFADILSAMENISQYRTEVVRTPVLRLSLRHNATLLCKAECVQPVGSFKIRGAMNFISRLDASCRGVVAYSAGNHASAVARAAKLRGFRSVIVMPTSVPSVKLKNTQADGAEVVLVGEDGAERRQRAESIAATEGLILVPPYDDLLIAAGQGTLALELIEAVGPSERYYIPISGGGLMSGCATVIRHLCPDAEIIGVEPHDGNDTYLSLMNGERVMIDQPKTIADGLRSRTPGSETWSVMHRLVDRVDLVSDRELLFAMAYAFEHLRVVLEPSGAAGLALALREGHGSCGVVLSGGNVDPLLFTQALAMLRS